MSVPPSTTQTCPMTKIKCNSGDVRAKTLNTKTGDDVLKCNFRNTMPDDSFSNRAIAVFLRHTTGRVESADFKNPTNATEKKISLEEKKRMNKDFSGLHNII